jgi:hypothetical protein
LSIWECYRLGSPMAGGSAHAALLLQGCCNNEQNEPIHQTNSLSINDD